MNTKADNRLTPKRIGEWAMNNTNILLMFLLIIVGALTSESFFSGHNLANVLRQITINGMLAVACTMTLLVNGFDLSIGHCMALSAVLCIGSEKQYGGGDPDQQPFLAGHHTESGTAVFDIGEVEDLFDDGISADRAKTVQRPDLQKLVNDDQTGRQKQRKIRQHRLSFQRGINPA